MRHTKYQRDCLQILKARGYRVDEIRYGSGSHMFVYTCAPNGKFACITIPADDRSQRGHKNWLSQLRRHERDAA
jgi:hypothetical protein